MEDYFSQVPHGIMFHHFHDDIIHPKGQGSISKDEFYKMLLLLMKRHRILGASEWYEKAISKKLLPNEICLTFDDNLLCQFDIALPVLNDLDIKAFWFIYTSPLDGHSEKLEIFRYFRSTMYNNFEDFFNDFMKNVNDSEYANEVKEALLIFNPDEYLKDFSFYSRKDKIYRYLRDHILKNGKFVYIMDQMILKSGLDFPNIAKKLWIDQDKLHILHANGHVLGLHSHTHPTSIEQLSFEEQKNEYTLNMVRLGKITGGNIHCMSHPCNSYNENTLSVLKDLGIKLGFRANMTAQNPSLLEYPRIDHSYFIQYL